MIESLVSVVIPCFNHEHELLRAVSSVLSQRYLHELIIVDDCSLDDSFSCAENIAASDPRIAVFKTLANSGPAITRNLGSRFSTGHYLSFLDADDEYTEDFLQMSVEALESSGGMQAIKTWAEFLGEFGEPLLMPEDPREEALVFGLSSNIVLVTEAFRKIGGFPEDSVFRLNHGGEDVAFNQAVAKFLTPLGRLDKVGYRVWSQPGDHLELFLRNTVPEENGFRFLAVSEAQRPGGILELAIENYLARVEKRMG